MNSRTIFLIIYLVFNSFIIYSQQIAFPSAEGYGKYTVGGRGGKVIEVTNLNPSGPGSLLEAVQATGARTVIFRVSGTIEGSIIIRNDSITIAGQTAPGDGITIKGKLEIKASNVIMRYIRIRYNGSSDAVKCNSQKHIILDHLSASWSRKHLMNITKCDSISIQWSILSESCGYTNYGVLFGNNYSTYHHNLFANNLSKNPYIDAGSGYNDFRNNVIFNWGLYSIIGGSSILPVDNPNNICSVNIVANYFKPGPGTDLEDGVNICSPSSSEGISDYGDWYICENFIVGDNEVTMDNWKGVYPRHHYSSTVGLDLDAIDRLKLNAPSHFMPINQHSATEAYQEVLRNVGCILPNSDTVDKRIINEVNNGTTTYGYGFVSDPNDAGGWPELNNGIAPTDTDHDGMPDIWEEEHGLNTNDPADKNNISNSGYTMLEEYLNGIGIATAIHESRSELKNSKAYPNPFTGLINFEINSHESQRAIIEIYNYVGKKISLISNVELHQGINYLSYNLNSPSVLLPGVYFINIKYLNENRQEQLRLLKK